LETVFIRTLRGSREQGQISKGKKALALARDCRNTYGENPEASRKGIRPGKQRSHMAERRAVGHVLRNLKENSDENEVIEADALAKTLILQKKRKAFKKRADGPLGVVIKRKLAERVAASEGEKE